MRIDNMIIFDHMVGCIDVDKLYDDVKYLVGLGRNADMAAYMAMPKCINPNYYFIADALGGNGVCTGVDVGIADAYTHDTIFGGGYHIKFDTPIPLP